jgi:hypothetical protein
VTRDFWKDDFHRSRDLLAAIRAETMAAKMLFILVESVEMGIDCGRMFFMLPEILAMHSCVVMQDNPM